MAETKRDNNGVEVMMGALNTGGETPTRMQADPSTHELQINDGATGSDAGLDLARRDGSGVPTLLATDANGSIITLFVNSSGQLLVQSS